MAGAHVQIQMTPSGATLAQQLEPSTPDGLADLIEFLNMPPAKRARGDPGDGQLSILEVVVALDELPHR